MTVHIPVMHEEVIEALRPRRGAFLIDGTLGGGGHARALIPRIQGGTYLGIDRDSEAIERFEREKPIGDVSVILVVANYAKTIDIVREQGLGTADGMLLDLGFSSDQIERSGRGFSFNRDEPLAMTYEPGQKPVKTILKELTKQELTEVIRRYSDERFAYRIAEHIKEHLRRNEIETSRALADVVTAAVPRNYERGRIHPATRTFQALRIYANDELGALRKLLEDIEWIVRPGGRVTVISFHSLEDRIVKTVFREKEKEGVLKIITKKPLAASEEERIQNPRARSAHLRVAEIV